MDTKTRANFKKVMDRLNYINYEITHPDPMAWGSMTVDECEASFLPDGEYYEEWGTKSENILIARFYEDEEVEGLVQS